MSLTGIVLALNAVGICLASLSILMMRDIIVLARSPRIKRAWRALMAICVACLGLSVFSTVQDIGREVTASDLATAALHALGPSFVFVVMWVSRQTARDMLRFALLEEAAFSDPLTGLANRRRFDDRLGEEIRRARCSGLALSLVVLDVDHFKRVNDTHGHQAGDRVLKRIAGVMAAKSGGFDTVCRIGGEEFALIMPGPEQAFIAAAAERLRRAIADASVPLDEGKEIWVTVSLGLASLNAGEGAADLARRADEALYAAKRAGRDRVSLAA